MGMLLSVIVMTAEGNVQSAVLATKAGATDSFVTTMSGSVGQRQQMGHDPRRDRR
jgi:DNA-binding NtrC family response regulator